MRERLRQFGGELVLDSDDSGIRISAVLPKVQSESEARISGSTLRGHLSRSFEAGIPQP